MPRDGASISARVRLLYEGFHDADTSYPMYTDSGSSPSKFNRPFLRRTLRHSALCNWTGSSRSSSKSLWRLLTSTPGGGPPLPASSAAVILASFKSPSSFTLAIKQEEERLVHLAGWREARLTSVSGTYSYMYRSGLAVLLGVLRDAPVKQLFTSTAVGVPAALVAPSRGAIFDIYEAKVRRAHGERAFVLPFSLFYDGTTLPNSGAASAHPLRIAPEFLPADEECVWLSLGAFPQVLAQLPVEEVNVPVWLIGKFFNVHCSWPWKIYSLSLTTAWKLTWAETEMCGAHFHAWIATALTTRRNKRSSVFEELDALISAQPAQPRLMSRALQRH